MKQLLMVLSASALLLAATACANDPAAAASSATGETTYSTYMAGAEGDSPSEAEQLLIQRQQLEDRLEETLAKMTSVDSADVSLAEDGRSAAVTLQMASGTTPEEAQITTVKNLVSASAEDLEPEAVTVVTEQSN